MTDIGFHNARTELLEAYADGEGIPLSEVLHEYRNNIEFRRRIDLAALNMSAPQSEAIH
jgi:hypothetical protein